MPYTRKYWTLKARVKGELSEEDFEMQEEQLMELRKGEILCRALFVSVDPITRLHLAVSQPGQPIPGRQIARVVESKNPDYAKGKLLVGSMGWSNYNIIDPTMTQTLGGSVVQLVENLPRQLESSSLPKSSALGLLGIPGLTAYIGLTEVAKAKPGETIVITSAAGQMGHLVGQIARNMGLKVIGYTGDSDKASWIKTELGFDWAFNYRTQDVNQTLKISAPQGVDIFWDAVGGHFAAKVLQHMAMFGRVIMVGNLSCYNNISEASTLPIMDLAITLKELSIIGFNVYRYYNMWGKARTALAELARNEKIKPSEHIEEGFEVLPGSLVNQLSGQYQAKLVVRI